MDAAPKKSSLGMEENTAAGLAELFGVIGLGIVTLIFFIIEKESQFHKFHALQALLILAVQLVLYILGSILMVIMIGFVFYILAIVPWIFGIIATVKAFQGEAYKVPVIGNLAEQWSGGTGR